MQLLQASFEFEFFTRTDPATATAVIIIFLVLVAAFILWSSISAKSEGTRRSGTYSRFAFRRRAKRMGLPKAHVLFLERLVKEFKTATPMSVLEFSGALDNLLRRAVIAVENSNIDLTAKENRKHIIYQIKQVADAHFRRLKILPSTSALRAGTVLTVKLAGDVGFQTQVIANLKDMLGLAMPELPAMARHLARNAVVLITAVLNETDVYSYRGRVLGFKTVKDTPVFFIPHARNVKQIQQRMSRRKSISRPAFFYKVTIVSAAGKKAARQAVINSRRIMGTLQDISAGGCAVLTHNPLPAGSLIKIDFETSKRNSISAFGKVRRVTGSGHRGRLMHIMFNSITKKNLNAIRDFVYGFSPTSFTDDSY